MAIRSKWHLFLDAIFFVKKIVAYVIFIIFAKNNKI